MSIQRARAALPVLFGGGGTYADKVLSYSPIAYWKLDDASGTTAVCSINAAQNGTYSAADIAGAGAGFPNGDTTPLFVPGTADRINVYSAALNTAWNGNELTILWWMKPAAGTWTDAAPRVPVGITGSSEHVYLYQLAADNSFQFNRQAGAVGRSANVTISSYDWICGTLVVSDSGDTQKHFFNGVQQGATLTGIGTWSSSLSTEACYVGALNNGGTYPWSGELAHVAIFASALSDAAVLDLATV